MINYTYKIINNTFTANINSTKQRLNDAVARGVNDGAQELSEYLKNDILSGHIVNKRTSQLRNSLYVRRGKGKATILFRGKRVRGPGENPGDELTNAQLAEILEYGLNKSWYQPKRKRWHRGIQAHYFMRFGLSKKKQRIIDLVRFHVLSELRHKTHA